MTAIAYRSGVMAGDTLCGHGYLTTNEVKIFKRDGYLIGMAGNDVPSQDDLARWFFLDPKSHKRHEMKGFEFSAMVVTPRGQIQVWDQRGTFHPISQKFWAIGSGGEVCMGAMEAGASASRAVAAAIKWAQGCGGRVITKKLKGK